MPEDVIADVPTAKENARQAFKNKARADGMRTVRRVAPYLWPEGKTWVKRRVVVSLLALVTVKLIAVGTPFFYKGAVDGLVGDSTPETGLLAIGVAGLVVAYGMAKLMTVAFQGVRDMVFARVGQRALREVALEAIVHIHRLSLRYHLTRRTGSLSRVLERGVKSVDFLLRYLLFNIGPLILELALISTVLIVVFDVWYLAIVTITVGFYVWFTTLITEWRVKIRKEMNDQDKSASQKAIDSLLNFETVKYFGAEKREADRYDRSMANYEEASLKTVNSLVYLNVGQAALINLGMVASLLLAAWDVANGSMTVGGFVMVNAYLIQVMMPLNHLGYVYREIRQALIDMDEMFDLLEQPAEIEDKPDAAALNVSAGEVSFSNVSFGYEPERTILKGVSFTARPGKMIAIVGASGAGKSTIGRLLFRFYDVNGGSIQIDGQDLRDVTQDSLHAAIGVVPQDTVLFNDTIYYNIAYGRPDASFEEIEAVAKATKIHDFIHGLPDGYQTMVGERGLKLSGGEKQRVGIARTLLKQPPVLLMDEATSALDTSTERDIQNSLRKMGEGRTVITIAHRLSTIMDADQIIVFDDGRVIEQGRHKALLDQQGQYARMWQRQLKEDSVLS